MELELAIIYRKSYIIYYYISASYATYRFQEGNLNNFFKVSHGLLDLANNNVTVRPICSSNMTH